MNQKLNLFLLSHGEFSEYLCKSAELIIGEIEYVYTFSLKKDMSISDFILIVENKLKEVNGQSVLLTDMFGGTPNNVAMYLKQIYKCEVISGMNLPLLLDLVISRDNSNKDLDSLLNDCILSGKNAITRHVVTDVTNDY